MPSYMSQFTDINQSLGFTAQRNAARIERFSAQLNFAHQLLAAHPRRAKEWEERIVGAGRMVTDGLKAQPVDLDDLVARGEAAMGPIGEAAKAYTLDCVSHAHIDMNWMWSWPETVAVTNDTFHTMLQLLEEFPGFIFSQSQAAVYQLVEKYNPPMFEAIRKRVQEGRWEVTASQWVEGDKNMSSGESICRHLLQTRAYFQEKFGLSPEDVTVDFEPDTFGHPATLPGILVRGGVKYYYHCRGAHGPHLYWWVGPDGSRLLAMMGLPWYMGAIEPKIADPLVEFCLATGMKRLAVFYGVGDHGGGPTRRDLRKLAEMNEWPVYPNVRFSALHDFFRRAEAEATTVPEITGERNFVFTGCYTSQARQKLANRHGENLLYAAEVAATVGERLARVEYPQQNLNEAWRSLLFDQFHDILPGSGVRETRHYTLGRAQEVQAAAGTARTNGLRALADQIDTQSLRKFFHDESEREFKHEQESGMADGAGVGHSTGIGGESAFSMTRTSDRAFLIFNPLAHPRTEVIEAKLWDTTLNKDHLVATADGAEPVKVQVLDEGSYWGHDYLTVAFPVEVPALGYRTVCVTDRLAELGMATLNVAEDPWPGLAGSWRMNLPNQNILENEFLRAEIEPASGGLSRLLDKRTGREWVPPGGRTGFFQYCLEQNIGMTAWVVGPYLKRADLLDGGALTRVHNGPFIHSFRWKRKVNDTSLALDISLSEGVPRLDFHLRVDWREIGDAESGTPHLNVRFPLEMRAPRPAYEVPFGSIERDLLAGEEVPAQRWADLSDGDGHGVTLVNSSKYGHSAEGSSLNLTLLRASSDPDPLPDLGEHIIEWALIPHDGRWTTGDCMRTGEDMNAPLTVSSCGFQKGKLPSSLSLVSVEPGNVRLTAMKMSQNGGGFILRLVEVEGKETEAAVNIARQLLPAKATAAEVDTLERPVDKGTARLKGGSLSVKLPAFGIASILIS